MVSNVKGGLIREGEMRLGNSGTKPPSVEDKAAVARKCDDIVQTIFFARHCHAGQQTSKLRWQLAFLLKTSR